MSFKPTYLYIKQHSVTGKLYFGKTFRDPEKYKGSGTHWLRHIKKHGKEHVVTLWYCLFYDKEELTKFAIQFSEQQNIVKSDDWLNLIEENGLSSTPIVRTKQVVTGSRKEGYTTFQSMRDAAQHHKVSGATITYWIKTGYARYA